ncbi:hypothetical protein ACJ65_01590 [Kocuria rhizophila]|nr:hypothetical protein ACJ65_01590 [Kocuria rhizophila]
MEDDLSCHDLQNIERSVHDRLARHRQVDLSTILGPEQAERSKPGQIGTRPATVGVALAAIGFQAGGFQSALIGALGGLLLVVPRLVLECVDEFA